MSMSLASQRLNALKRAEDNAKDPEFKKLWASKREELVQILQSGNSYDELTGELIC
tara:strand:- start:125 stop:292 length:168 start_codon:yes stop_codon:yes gene_type:complete